jgi:hypothetical protein
LADLVSGVVAGNRVVEGRDFRDMMADASFVGDDLTFTRFVAEALIARDGPQEISARAVELGLPELARDVAVAACVGTACDCSNVQPHDLMDAAY